MLKPEHLPECWAKHQSDPEAWCICDELRACEERVLREAQRLVAALPEYRMRDTCIAAIEALRRIAAIEALREDSETPPPLPPSVGVPERRWT